MSARTQEASMNRTEEYARIFSAEYARSVALRRAVAWKRCAITLAICLAWSLPYAGWRIWVLASENAELRAKCGSESR